MITRTLRYCLVVATAAFLPSHGFVILQPQNLRAGSVHPICDPRRHVQKLYVSSGFSFNDGQQILVSAQKPLGIILEEQQDEDDTTRVVVVLVEIFPASPLLQQGVRVGDVMLAVQNMNVRNQSLEKVMAAIAQAPRVVNLRFERQQAGVDEH